MTMTKLPLNFDRDAYDEDLIDVYALARLLGVSLCRLGELTGLPPQVIYDPELRLTATHQAQLRAVIDVFELLSPKVDCVGELIDMVANTPIYTLGGFTAAQLFTRGRAPAVLRVLRSAAFPHYTCLGGRYDIPRTLPA